ncbi:MAG: hypothetical protein PUG93_00865 [Oscillospiraceae bacterium]|nr:hypothetical protein [Oscillospiraceae bacterium]MDY3937000.1 hypothetical protein [Oscillospiraceae bacterium]
MLRINEISLPLGANTDVLRKEAAKTIGVSPDDFTYFSISRESIDSRKKNSIKMIYSVDVELESGEEDIASKFELKKVMYRQRYKYIIPECKRTSALRPVIAGFGPAGMFCGLILAQAGLRPIILERGNDVETRTKDVKCFWANRLLNTESNVQFGEGGAGTFSDGKLTTGIKDGRVREVFNQLYSHGAPEDIMYSARPHIGTDKLGGVVKNIREDIISMGGEVHFGCKLTDIIYANDFIHGIEYTTVSDEVKDIETDCLVLCIGHSARDTVKMLFDRGVRMEQKAFSVGTRIEHPQELINKAQYGSEWNNPLLGAADYKLSNHPPHGRGGYTFCMCPGGTVVAASSEEGGMVVNGMSEYARDGENANTALLVGLEPGTFGSDNPLAGIELQRKIERAGFVQGGGDYTAPAQLVGDFLNDRKSTKLGAVRPTCPTGVALGDIRTVLPEYVTKTIAEAIVAFDKKLKNYALPDAVLTAPESRSSSPVRILRDEFMQTNIRGLYPCGEGAGYAGGIVSAAVDGMKCAEAVLNDET